MKIYGLMLYLFIYKSFSKLPFAFYDNFLAVWRVGYMRCNAWGPINIGPTEGFEIIWSEKVGLNMHGGPKTVKTWKGPLEQAWWAQNSRHKPFASFFCVWVFVAKKFRFIYGDERAKINYIYKYFPAGNWSPKPTFVRRPLGGAEFFSLMSA